MNIQGFQKLTLLDYPGHMACTVFTGGCNFRCPFCHNAGLVLTPDENESFTQEEIFDVLKKRRGILDGVAVTGGEPLLQKDIADFLCKVKELGFAVKLDTNGSFPDKLRELVNAGLTDYVAMDIKNSEEKYGMTVGKKNFDIEPVKESVSFLLEGKTDFEFRTTVIKQYHTVKDIKAIAEWIKGAPRYFLQAFKDSGNLIDSMTGGCTEEEMNEMRAAAAEFIPDTQLRGI